jgi:stage V sporulation protein G
MEASMQITDIRVRQVFDEGKMKARVSITFDDQFVVHEIKVIEGENGVFIAMPSKKLSGGEFKDIAHPINKETRALLQDAILKAYQDKVRDDEANLATAEE